MPKKDQKASWESDHLQGAKKPVAARVPEVNKVGKDK